MQEFIDWLKGLLIEIKEDIKNTSATEDKLYILASIDLDTPDYEKIARRLFDERK